MAQFLGIHNTNDFLIDKNKPVEGDPWEVYKKSCMSHDCKPLHVHFNQSYGKAFCVTEASSAEKVQAAHDDVNLKLEDLIEVDYSD